MKIKIITVIALSTFLMFTMTIVSHSAEPIRPSVNHEFATAIEARIQNLESLSARNAFDSLKSKDFIINDKILNKGVFTAYNRKPQLAIQIALKQLESPVVETINGQMINRRDSFHIAKKILHIFPDHAIDFLLNRYGTGDAITRGNIIGVLGGMESKNDTIKHILIDALGDTTTCETENPEIAGLPLRICDVAYNQLILRYDIKDTLRVIGNIHRIEVRDYHIERLKKLL